MKKHLTKLDFSELYALQESAMKKTSGLRFKNRKLTFYVLFIAKNFQVQR